MNFYTIDASRFPTPHRVGACLGTATRTRKLLRNPMLELAKVPSPAEADHGMVLEEEQLLALVRGFKESALFSIVAVAAIEETDEHGLRIKGPKTERGKRTITIDAELLSLLLAEREKHLRIVAGVPDGAPVDLSLVKLPTAALMFPNPPSSGESFSFTKLRNPRNTTKEFVRKATLLGFAGLRLHDLRGTHETLLLNRGIPIHEVAARCGHDPAVMLRSYAKRTKKADEKAADVTGALFKGMLQ